MKKNINKLILYAVTSLCLLSGMTGCTASTETEVTSMQETENTDETEEVSETEETGAESGHIVDTIEEAVMIGDRTQIKENTVLHNTALGVRLDLPENWWISSVDNENLNQVESVTQDRDTMKLFQVNEQRSLINMIEIANYDERNTKDDYFALLYNGEAYTTDITMDEYMLDLKARIVGGDPTGLIFDADEYVEINGTEFYSFGFTDEYSDPNGVYRFYIKEDDGYFMAFTFFHYVTHENGQVLIDEFMKNNVSYSK